MKNLTSICAVVAWFLFAIGCSPESGDPITIIIPDDYTGVFRIEEDKLNGSELDKIEGRFIYRIPDSGILVAKDMSPFDVFHGTSVRTRNGREFPHGFLEMSDDTVGFYYLWTNTEGTTWFLIGTDEDYQAAQKSGRVQVGPDFLPPTNTR